MSFVDPTLTSSPLARSCSRTGVPLTLVPLVDPRSVTKTPSPFLPQLGVAPAHVGVGQHHVALGQAADDQGLRAQGDPPPVGQDELGQEAAVLALVHLGGDGEPPRLEVRTPRRSRPRPGRRTSTPRSGRAPGRRRRARRESASMKFANRLTSAGESVTAKALGAMRPRTPTRRCRSISRVSLRPISTGWRLLRNGLANVPSTRRSRRSSNCWSPMVSQRLPVRCARQGFGRRLTWSPVSRSGRQSGSGPVLERLLLAGHSGEWRNWQTRRIQVPVSERMCGFKSRLAHSLSVMSRDVRDSVTRRRRRPAQEIGR